MIRLQSIASGLMDTHVRTSVKDEVRYAVEADRGLNPDRENFRIEVIVRVNDDDLVLWSSKDRRVV